MFRRQCDQLIGWQSARLRQGPTDGGSVSTGAIGQNRATRGIPRSINILCDMALVYGFAAELTEIKVAVIDEILRDRSEYGLLPAPTA